MTNKNSKNAIKLKNWIQIKNKENDLYNEDLKLLNDISALVTKLEVAKFIANSNNNIQTDNQNFDKNFNIYSPSINNQFSYPNNDINTMQQNYDYFNQNNAFQTESNAYANFLLNYVNYYGNSNFKSGYNSENQIPTNRYNIPLYTNYINYKYPYYNINAYPRSFVENSPDLNLYSNNPYLFISNQNYSENPYVMQYNNIRSSKIYKYIKIYRTRHIKSTECT